MEFLEILWFQLGRRYCWIMRIIVLYFLVQSIYACSVLSSKALCGYLGGCQVLSRSYGFSPQGEDIVPALWRLQSYIKTNRKHNKNYSGYVKEAQEPPNR